MQLSKTVAALSGLLVSCLTPVAKIEANSLENFSTNKIANYLRKASNLLYIEAINEATNGK